MPNDASGCTDWGGNIHNIYKIREALSDWKEDGGDASEEADHCHG